MRPQDFINLPMPASAGSAPTVRRSEQCRTVGQGNARNDFIIRSSETKLERATRIELTLSAGKE
jgi:hypothetical protein